MDAIDFAICMNLVVNSRISYRQLAETFNMSVNSIHKRIKNLVNLGVIDKFTTQFSGTFFNFSNVVMFGTSKAKDLEDLLPRLGNHECIYNVTQASGNLLYFHGYIRNLNELDPLVSFIRQQGEIDELTVGLTTGAPIPTQDQSEKIVSKLDFLIVNALKDNSRKPLPEVADEVGASAKTVRRHLNQLIEKHLVEFSIHWYPDKSDDIMSIIILRLKPDVDKMNLIVSLRKKYGVNFAFSWIFSNLPKLMLVCFWTNKMKELQKIESSLRSEKVESITTTILLRGKMYPMWKDKFLEEKIKEINAI